MISNCESRIINKLVDKYENSKSFTGENKVNQKFSIKVSVLFPQYADHSNYEVFQGVNDAIDILIRKEIIRGKANGAKVYDEIVLNVDSLAKSYEYVKRKPKKDVNEAILTLMETYQDKNEILNKYCKTQCARIHANKSIQFFYDDVRELENILLAVAEVVQVAKETFVRDFSVRIFKDSKKFEEISSKVVNLLYEYGDFPEKELVLGNLNIIKNPTYINVKGAGSLLIKGQKIDLSSFSSDIGISSTMIGDIESIAITGKALITIENLTSFHSFCDASMFAIYLGGYHNSVRREFIQKIYRQNPEVDFYHFGDIDAGGFYIVKHLKRETGIEFKTYKMDVDTLRHYNEYTKQLTDNDKQRLLLLMDSEYSQVITYMMENNCKLEQEAIELSCGRERK